MLKLDTRSIVLAGLIVFMATVLRLDEGMQNAVASQAPQATVAFTKDIAPILYEHCAVCHHPGGWGPFSLLTYDDVRPRARQIANVVRRRLMPPWKPESGYGGPFVGERRLNDEQIRTYTKMGGRRCCLGRRCRSASDAGVPGRWLAAGRARSCDNHAAAVHPARR